MLLPQPRGPLSAATFDRLRGGAGSVAALDVTTNAEQPDATDLDATNTVEDEDLQLTLWCLYELHYRGFDDVDSGLEWAPDLLELRRRIEIPFERDLRGMAEEHLTTVASQTDDLAERLFGLAAALDGPPLSEHVQRRATRDQIRELLMLRSIYQLKEADPHSWAIPRLTGAAKAGLVELQYDEYGDGRADRMHQDLFAAALRGAGLDDGYGAYVDRVPAATLATSNAMSLFGLHRRLRGAAMGHLAAFEASSSVPCRRYAAGIRRVDLPEEVARYFDEHVEADAVHEQLAARGICTALVAEEPELEADVLLGAVTCLLLDALTGERLLTAWQHDQHLIQPPPEPVSTAAGACAPACPEPELQGTP
ncbi:iron-containing redox enzyme family protein [Microlunatus panaciterrae]|uniref:Iron-containing redox enzyme n=1 Tax=Microlunatus panaciterrae TaxID=400768 RepID=A0ABS2RFB8_9ACTN|nr:iron-containing redox enzyme family protein [Microlunatus panaciterrae]MBM7797690.1 hypothetical protein [Microlunatus panaciterrae]